MTVRPSRHGSVSWRTPSGETAPPPDQTDRQGGPAVIRLPGGWPGPRSVDFGELLRVGLDGTPGPAIERIARPDRRSARRPGKTRRSNSTGLPPPPPPGRQSAPNDGLLISRGRRCAPRMSASRKTTACVPFDRRQAGHDRRALPVAPARVFDQSDPLADHRPTSSGGLRERPRSARDRLPWPPEERGRSGMPFHSATCFGPP
jgi:hypothetical protein